ncbi:Hsp33 family molecular chaperone [Rhodoligotrophos ferricapiens]|uniref:Hsp33 family molecular chaperone n=1 Tax=Rhodoligotrophos ferricapiens TaxID=3069264 RepID=UPI00315C8356
MLAEAVALTTMLGSSLKFDGKLILQTSTDGPVDLLVADFSTPGEVRAYAHYDEERVAELEREGSPMSADLLGKGHLALTIDQGRHMDRYQGIVPLDGASLSEAANTYFEQSEQLPTDVRLAAGPIMARGEGGAEHWRAGGIMIQHLPAEGEPSALPVRSGDLPEGVEEDEQEEDENWVRARIFLATVEDHELLDPTLSPEELLYRLFHEDGVTVYPSSNVQRYCQCSRERISDIVSQFSPEEISEMVVDGKISATCEFCSTVYEFDLRELKKDN